MAEVTSGYFDGDTSSAGDRLRVYWEIRSQNVENNTSTIYWKIYPVAWEAGWAEVPTTTLSRDGGSAWIYFYDHIGQPNSYPYRTWRSGDYVDGTFTISHNADGTRQLSLAAGLRYDNLGYHEKSGSWELKHIDRGLFRLHTPDNTWKTGQAYIKPGDNWKLGQVFINTPSGWKRGI